MATSKSQRIFIWVIAIVMAVGSVGFYFVIIMDNDRVARNQEDQQAALDKAIKEQQSQNQVLPGYTVDTFDAAAVTELKTEDLKVGEGPEVPAGATVKANYTGWLADGTIFDSSNKNGTVTPISFSLNGVIAGWTEGIPGMKVGGVRKLTIPADKAYGASGTNGIPPNSPLVFVVEIVGIE